MLDQARWLSHFRSIKTSGAPCGNSTATVNNKDRTIGRKSIEISYLASWILQVGLYYRPYCVDVSVTVTFSRLLSVLGEGTIEEDEFTAINARGDVSLNECSEAFNIISQVGNKWNQINTDKDNKHLNDNMMACIWTEQSSHNWCFRVRQTVERIFHFWRSCNARQLHLWKIEILKRERVRF